MRTGDIDVLLSGVETGGGLAFTIETCVCEGRGDVEYEINVFGEHCEAVEVA